jgi:hypothetical protein
VPADKSLNPEHTHALASTIAAQHELLCSPADLKTNVVFAARGMLSGNGSGGFISLVTDAHGLFASLQRTPLVTLLVAERRQSGVGIYQPPMPPPSQA